MKEFEFDINFEMPKLIKTVGDALYAQGTKCTRMQ
jgi:hypothetical protein